MYRLLWYNVQMITLICQKCYKNYLVANSREKTSKYCSKICHNSVAGKAGGLAGKGVTRNKGVIRKDLSERNKIFKITKEKHYLWKGDEVGYGALHAYIRRNFGKAIKCEKCFSTKSIHWANKSHKYKRDRSDWFQLCSSCHKRYDIDTKHIIGKYKNHKRI